jgi:uncharacterized membrane protein
MKVLGYRWPFNFLIVCVIISIVIAVVSLTLFIAQFSSSTLSTNPQDWGVFGDYVGGTINPVVSTLNLLVSIWIALLLSKISNEQNDKQIHAQQQIVLLQIRNEVFRHFRHELNEAFNTLDKDRFKRTYIDNCIKIMQSFAEAYTGLFDLHENDTWGDLGLSLTLMKASMTQENNDSDEERRIKAMAHFHNAVMHKSVLYGRFLNRFFFVSSGLLDNAPKK